MFTQPTTITFILPEWVSAYAAPITAIPDLQDRMSFVIEASRKNVEKRTGGPFAAAVFEMHSGTLIALGVNGVVEQGMSILHAEMIALAVAQKKLATYDLSSQGLAKHELVMSTEPCAMCFGGIQWAGLKRVVSGATDEDARRIGFDEGVKAKDWKQALQLRGIDVITEVQRHEAAAVLSDYLETGGLVYNPGQASAGTGSTNPLPENWTNQKSNVQGS